MIRKLFQLASMALLLTVITTNMSFAQTGKQLDPVRSFLTNDEVEVIKEINLARTQPKKYAEILRQYAAKIVGNQIMVPGCCPIELHEGRKAVDEAIQILENMAPLKALKASKGLSAAAEDHAKEQGRTGETGHDGANGSTTYSRIEKYGEWLGSAGENCNYGSSVPRDIVIDLIVDDGIASRGHRANILSADFNTVGVAIEKHSQYGTVCVQDFAGGFKGR